MDKNVDLGSAVEFTAAHPRLNKSPEEEEKSLHVFSVSVLPLSSVERFSVSRMQDFLLHLFSCNVFLHMCCLITIYFLLLFSSFNHIFFFIIIFFILFFNLKKNLINLFFHNLFLTTKILPFRNSFHPKHFQSKFIFHNFVMKTIY